MRETPNWVGRAGSTGQSSARRTRSASSPAKWGGAGRWLSSSEAMARSFSTSAAAAAASAAAGSASPTPWLPMERDAGGLVMIREDLEGVKIGGAGGRSLSTSGFVWAPCKRASVSLFIRKAGLRR